MASRLRARFVWSTPYRVVGPAELRIDDGGRVAGLRPVRTAPDVAVFPGLVNAHAHLQLGRLPAVERDFVRWVRGVMAMDARPEAVVRRLRRNVNALLADGTTAVGEIDATGASVAVLGDLGIAGRCYREVTGFDVSEARAASALLAARPARGTRVCPAGRSPHAPYSVSLELARACAREGLPTAVHVAETEEEIELVAHGRGPFRDLLADLGKLGPGTRAPGVTPVEWLARAGLLGSRCTLIHCQHLGPEDPRRIRRAGAGIVVCPGTIGYFGRRPPPVPEWLALGIPVGLGTDSLASNTRLSMRLEMRRAHRLWPQLAPAQVLAMATTLAARCLRRPACGRLRQGAAASFVVVHAGAPAGEVLERFTHGEAAPIAVWSRGTPRTVETAVLGS